MTKNGIFIIILGLMSVILIAVGLFQFNTITYIDNLVVGVKNQFGISIAIAVFIVFSIGILFFVKEWLVFFSGILFGLSLAGLLGGYHISLFLLIFIFANELRRVGIPRNIE